MAHKTKLTKPMEWWKHLRPYNKRRFNKAERRNNKQEISKEATMYADKKTTWCIYYKQCKHGETCPRALTPEVIGELEKFDDGVDGFRMKVHSIHPNCFVDMTDINSDIPCNRITSPCDVPSIFRVVCL